MKHFLLCLSAVLVVAMAGCDGNIRFGGKVAFEDGSPLTAGTVFFEANSFLARGEIRQDGTYTLGSLKESDGLPPGTYRVYINNAMVVDGVDQKSGMPNMKPLIAEKFSSGETSGLIVEVSASTQRFDITVEKP